MNLFSEFYTTSVKDPHIFTEILQKKGQSSFILGPKMVFKYPGTKFFFQLRVTYHHGTKNHIVLDFSTDPPPE